MSITENIELQSNEELIQHALNVLIESYPTIHIYPDEFYIKIWKGKHGVAIDFTRIIQYIPLSKAQDRLTYDIVVNLRNKEIIPFNDQSVHGEFFIPSPKDLEALAFIHKHFGVFSSQFKNTIHEGETEYHISCDNDASFGRYTVNKITGEQGPAIQGSYEKMIKPLIENDPFEGID